MLLKQIEYFTAVVESGSFSEAAERCFISQSAVSQQIRALEKELGVQLLLREHRSFTLTPAGEYFYRKSTVILNDLRRLQREVSRLNEEDAVLKVGYLRCYSGNEFQEAVAAFSERFPDVQLQIHSGNHEDLYDALRSGEVDLVLNDQRRAFSDEYVNYELVESRCYAEISARHPFARLSSIELEDLHNDACILVSSREQQQNEAAYYRNVAGVRSDFLFAETLPEARLLVVSGRGFLPVEGVREDVYYDSSIVRIPLCHRGQQLKRKYFAFWKKEGASSYAEDFAEIMKEQFLL